MMQGMSFSWLIVSHKIFGPRSKRTVVFWTSLARINVNTDSAVCFVLGLFHAFIGHLFWCLLTLPQGISTHPLPGGTATLFHHTAAWHSSERKQLPCLTWLHLERSKLLGKQERHAFEMSDSCF